MSVKGKKENQTLSESTVPGSDTSSVSGADEQIPSWRTCPSATASCTPFAPRATTPRKVLELQLPRLGGKKVVSEISNKAFIELCFFYLTV